MTQKELAKVVGKTNSAIYDWENGRSYPNLEELVVIADYFRVATDLLLGRIHPYQPMQTFREDLEKNRDKVNTVTLIKKYTKANMELLSHIIDTFYDDSNSEATKAVQEIFKTVGYRIDVDDGIDSSTK